MPTSPVPRIVATVTALALAGFVGGIAPASAAPHATGAPACTPQPSDDDRGFSVADLNADGVSDLVVGAPDATASGLATAGIEDIRYPQVPPGGGAVTGTTTQRIGESFFGQTPAAGDRFGASTAYTASIEPLGCYGLAIGAPGAAGGRGQVTLAHGTNTGISPDDATVLTGTTPGDGFGSVVVADGVNADGLADDSTELWVAAPDATVAGHPDAGAVYHYHYVSSTSTATLVQVVTENSPFVPGDAATGDHFGAALSVQDAESDAIDGDLTVGIPGKTVDGRAGAGAVAILRAATTGTRQLVGGAEETQDSPGVPGGSEAGDGFGTSVSLTADVLAVGVPGEDLGSTSNAGSVQTLYDWRPTNPNGPVVRVHVGEALTQESPGVPGTSRAHDRFGASVQVGAGDNDEGRGERPYLWIGVPGKTLDSVGATGEVIPLLLPFDGKWQQNGSVIALGKGGLPGSPQTAAHVGATLGLFSGTYYGFIDDVVNGDGIVVDVPEYGPNGSDAGEVDNVGGYGTNVANPGVYTDSIGPQPREFYGVAASNVSNGTFDDG